MLSLGVLFTCIGTILVLFNTVKFSFVKDQVNSKKQVITGFIFLGVGVILLIISIKNLMQGE